MRKFLLVLIAVFQISVAFAEEETCKPSCKPTCKLWGVTLFLAEGSTHGIEKIITDANLHLKRTFFASVEVIRQVTCWEKVLFFNNVILEVEGQVAKHWGKQHNGELTFAPIIRFNTITWPDVISMNFAVGDGISQALGKPKFETVRVRTLNYLLMEGAFFLPDKPDWQMVLRWHHRCKCFGVFSSKHQSGSNFIALGLRHRF